MELRQGLFRLLNKLVILVYPSPQALERFRGRSMNPGLRLRQERERLGLTYRDVERASYDDYQCYHQPKNAPYRSHLHELCSPNEFCLDKVFGPQNTMAITATLAVTKPPSRISK